MGESKIHRYTAAHAIVTWDAGLCRHAEECVHGLPQVFDPKAKPWIAAHAATFEALAATIRRCPSGALKLLHPDGTLAAASGPQKDIAAVPETVVRVRPNGPNIVTGAFFVAGPRVVEGAKASVSLCRCGKSSDKPFCDGTHTKIGFQDPGLLPADAPPGVPSKGMVTITPTQDGPLECIGPLTVHGADGRTSTSEETRRCRCGHSRTKPFCDGSHEKVGFKA